MKNILEVKNLCTSFFTEEGEVKAVNGVSFSVPSGRTLGIVGESGSGKSITSLSILRLIQSPGKIKSGEILFDGKDLLQLSEKDMRKIRGNEISMIFQEPMTSLNPVFTIGEQISEVYQIHRNLSKREAKEKSIEMLKLVGIPSPEKRIDQYPHELSGGMRQRVMIAMALACNPKLLIADEPTTALDVTIQAQILRLIKELQEKLHMSVIFITHDLGVVAETCDYVAVMYCGKVVEFADVKTLFKNPQHPYTVGLLNSLPRHDIDQEELIAIKGNVPSPFEMPNGCAFAPRCPHASAICHTKEPELVAHLENNEIRCWIYSNEWDGNKEVDVNGGQRTINR
ncbi:ABC transporter ATP-binding protein [Caldibacillus thermolactis]|uniref:ABC transporter ATP-binding protein n=1 Tax=Pallidibacillus thermolactis TaxID=251051 RepID=A0ABT2WH13_9BACI|nr:ABC transporter ATP-binding protein [Pallidibacillus thermolactis]MCU9594830.1 ABC transporter ATP-binding protein [Pallidibacillus thermolactis]MCU9600165.1 ABC transporter ATP-binding protein [Pallidibacillus thermolactis subsp. kokeshiiformis]